MPHSPHRQVHVNPCANRARRTAVDRRAAAERSRILSDPRNWAVRAEPTYGSLPTPVDSPAGYPPPVGVPNALAPKPRRTGLIVMLVVVAVVWVFLLAAGVGVGVGLAIG